MQKVIASDKGQPVVIVEHGGQPVVLVGGSTGGGITPVAAHVEDYTVIVDNWNDDQYLEFFVAPTSEEGGTSTGPNVLSGFLHKPETTATISSSVLDPKKRYIVGGDSYNYASPPPLILGYIEPSYVASVATAIVENITATTADITFSLTLNDDTESNLALVLAADNTVLVEATFTTDIPPTVFNAEGLTPSTEYAVLKDGETIATFVTLA